MSKHTDTTTAATFENGALKLTQKVTVTRRYLWGLIVITTWHTEPMGI